MKKVLDESKMVRYND